MITKTKFGEEQVERIEDAIFKFVFERTSVSVKSLRFYLAGFRSPEISENMKRKLTREKMDNIINRMISDELLKWHFGKLFIPLNVKSIVRLSKLGLISISQGQVLNMQNE